MAVRARLRALQADLRDRVRIETRSLAAFRIALGLLILADLLLRSRSLTAFYTDAGVFPRTAFVAHAHPLHLSLHTISGSLWVQVALFVLAGVAAVALTLGYRTTTATILSWLLLVSLHNRHPLVLNGGDTLLRLLLFWGLFLPLGERWSIDRLRATAHRTHVLGVATVALLLQVVIVYSTNAALKLTGPLWLRGQALEYVLSLDQFTILLGNVLGSYPLVLHALDYLWLGLVVAAPLLVLLTGRWRIGLVSLFVVMHLGMALSMRLGLFPLISVASLLPFLPGGFWDGARARLPRSRTETVLHRWTGALDAALPVITVSNVSPHIQRWKARANTIIPLFFLILIILWNLQFLGFSAVVGQDVAPEEAEQVMHLTRTNQYWNMFAPDPLVIDGWYVVPGVLANGSRVDAFHGGPVQWDRPDDIASMYPSARWRKYLINIWRDNPSHQGYFASYLCQRWNSNHETELRNLTVYFMKQPTRLDGPEPVTRVKLDTEYC